MHTPVIAALAVCAIWLAGVSTARLVRLQGALFLAASWLFGSALLALLMLLASALQVPYTRPLLALCWAIAVAGPWCAGRLLDPVRRLPARASYVPFPVLADLPALLVCLFQFSFVALQAVRVPLGSFDAWALWEYKGRRFWMDGGVSASFLHDHAAIFAHPAYPPLVPLLITWVYTWLGAADPTLMKPIFPAFFAALLLTFFGALRPRLGPHGALLATAALALVPRIAEYAGTGLADVPMAAALVAVAACLVRWHEEGRASALAGAGLLLGVALLIKHDAIVFAAAGLFVVAALAYAGRPGCFHAAGARNAGGTLLRFLLPACLISAPWYVYVRITGVPDRDFLPLTLHNVIAHAGRVGGIARLFSLNLLAADEWGVLWYAFGALILLGLVRGRLRAPVLLMAVLPPLVLYVLSLSLSAWPDYMLHTRTSLDRLILVTAPFALWFVAEQLRPASQEERSSPRR